MNSGLGKILEQSGRLLVYLGILALPVANAPITGDTLEIKMHLFRLLGTAAALLYTAIIAMRRGGGEADTPGIGVVASALVVVASLAAAESHIASLPGALDAILSLAIFCLAREVFADHDHDFSRTLLLAVGMSTLLPALLYLGEHYRTGITDTLGNQNVVSHYLLLSLCAPLFLLLAPGRCRIIRGLGATILIGILWIIWTTAARGAVIGVLFAIFVGAAVLAARHWPSISKIRRGAIVGICMLAFAAAGGLLYKYASATDFNVSVRFLTWKYSISLLKDRLLLGYGPGSFLPSFEKTKLWMSAKDAELLGPLTVNYAHNDYVEIAVEQGALGLTVFLFLAGACVAGAARRWIRHGPGTSAISEMSLPILLSVSASLAQAFFDFPYHTGATRFLFYVLLAMLVPVTRPDPATAGASPPTATPDASTRANVTMLKNDPSPGRIVSVIILIVALVTALPVLTIYAGAVISKVAEPMFKAGRYEAVVHLHEWAAHLDPTRSAYRFREGLGYEQAGRTDEARTAFRRSLELAPYFPNVYFHLGVVDVKDDPARAAANLYANLAFNITGVALHNLAAACLILGDSPTATSVYSEIARRSPSDPVASRNASILRSGGSSAEPPSDLEKARDLYQQNRYDDAQGLAERHIRDHPDDSECYFLLGKIAFHRNRYDASLSYVRRYIAMRPDDAEGYYYLGNIHYFQDRIPEAEAAYIEAARRNPTSSRFVYNLGVAYYTHRNFSAMKNCFDTAISLNPSESVRKSIEQMRQSIRPGAPHDTP